VISDFVVHYGYLAVFLGTVAEGETILIAAGFAAHGGLLDWRLVMLVAMIGGTLGDQLAFLLGRWKGKALLRRLPVLARREPRIRQLLHRYDAILILSVRFLYGLRIAGPAILGSYHLPLLRFAFFNAIGAAIWSVLVTGAGYAFGVTVNALVGDIEQMEGVIVFVIIALGAVVALARAIIARRARPRDETKRE
jgi:membrane protein DedA with SNARE-associated domain